MSFFKILLQPVKTGAATGERKQLPGDGGVGDGHDEGGHHQHDDQHIQLEPLPVSLEKVK